MKRIQFTEGDILKLRDERLQHAHPIVRRRMMALYLKAQGYVLSPFRAILPWKSGWFSGGF